jgi:hypothetical protein
MDKSTSLVLHYAKNKKVFPYNKWIKLMDGVLNRFIIVSNTFVDIY